VPASQPNQNQRQRETPVLKHASIFGPSLKKILPCILFTENYMDLLIYITANTLLRAKIHAV